MLARAVESGDTRGARAVRDELDRRAGVVKPPAPDVQWTPRRAALLALLAEGVSHEEAAARIGKTSRRGVADLARCIRRVLEVGSDAEAVVKGRELGLIG